MVSVTFPGLRSEPHTEVGDLGAGGRVDTVVWEAVFELHTCHSQTLFPT